jgi:hypothetical protein
MMVGWCDQFSLGDGAGTAWRSRVLHPERPSSRGGVNMTEANSSSGLKAHMPRLSGGASLSKSPDQYFYILIATYVSLLTSRIERDHLRERSSSQRSPNYIFWFPAMHLQRNITQHAILLFSEAIPCGSNLTTTAMGFICMAHSPKRRRNTSNCG